MTYIVNDNCINCKYTDCVEVCPVDCFYEGENMLVIHPDECIDCGVCEPECPPEAILPDSEPEAEKWLELNREMSEIWPNIGQKIDAMPEAEKMQDETGKFDKYFSKAPGKGALNFGGKPQPDRDYGQLIDFAAKISYGHSGNQR